MNLLRYHWEQRRAAFAGWTPVARVGGIQEKEIKETSRLRLGSCSCGICEEWGGWCEGSPAVQVSYAKLTGRAPTWSCSVPTTAGAFS